MSDETQPPEGPDLSAGVSIDSIPESGMLSGHVGDQPVMLVRRGKKLFAIGSRCTHYGGPLSEGLLVGNTVRCPWHHACFDVRTGEALHAPALDPVAVWEVVRDLDQVRVTREIVPPVAADLTETPVSDEDRESFIIVGAGGAGNAAAEMLRRDGFAGDVTIIGMEDSVPYDRPNLSKDYLAGSAPEEWIPLRSGEFYAEQRIELLRNMRVVSIDHGSKKVELSDGSSRKFDKLLMATGSEPVVPPIPGADMDQVHYLRSLADSRSIIAAAKDARQVVVIGSSFIGLEVAGSLRARGLLVNVVAPETTPLQRVLGPELGAFIRATHEKNGVTFYSGRTVTGIARGAVRLDNGDSLPADIVIIGVGVRPLTRLAVDAGADMDRGVRVDERMETSLTGVYAAGDIARYPDPRSGESLRIEHWVVAERQGQTAAKNMMGGNVRFKSVPFFWSNHYDVSIAYVGHAERWDNLKIAGDVAAGNCYIAYMSGKKTLAVATVGRPMASLEAEAALEKKDWKMLADIFEREAALPG